MFFDKKTDVSSLNCADPANSVLYGFATARGCTNNRDTRLGCKYSVNPPQQVVQKLVGRNLEPARQALHAYQGTRIYRVEYRGFPGSRDAEMIVDVKYRAPGTKEFTIRSVTGAKLIIDKVFRKLLEAEQAALAADIQGRTALNSDNYDFTMLGYESTPFGSMYVLRVEPRTKDKFLYRGRIWVDSEDFAVIRLQGEPTKNPSIWTKDSELRAGVHESERFLASRTQP